MEFICNICPRNCNINRTYKKGYCKATNDIKLAKAAPFFYEEPVVSGSNGTGAVFFSGCNLQCCYCQNYRISHELFGEIVTEDKFSDILLSLADKNVDSISLISPTIYVLQIVKALDKVRHKIKIPIIYNTSGYEKEDTVKLINDYIDVYLPDIKYMDPVSSMRYSNAADYFNYCSSAVKKMLELKPKLVYRESILTSGVLIRHLVLPGLYKDSINILDWIKNTINDLKAESLISIMSQYMPYYMSCNYPEINRKVTKYEYNKVLSKAKELHLEGFMQDNCSSSDSYVPDFNLEGII